MPLIDPTITSSKLLAESIGGVAAVYKLDPNTNYYTNYYLPAIDYPPGGLPLSIGKAFLVSLNDNAPDRWFTVGGVPEKGSAQFTIAKTALHTWNEIYIPLDCTHDTLPSILAEEIGGVIGIFKIDPKTNYFTIYYLPAIDFYYPEPFMLKPGEPVLISVDQNAPNQWPGTVKY